MASARAIRLSPSVEKQKLKLELLRGSKPKLENLPVSVVVHEHLVRAGCMFFRTTTRRTLMLRCNMSDLKSVYISVIWHSTGFSCPRFFPFIFKCLLWGKFRSDNWVTHCILAVAVRFTHSGIFLGTSQLAYRRQKLGRSPSPARGVRGHAPPGNF